MLGVLITGCSMHSKDLIDVLRDNYDGEEIHVVGINCDDAALLRNGVDSGYVVPRITDPNYIQIVIDICKKEHVDVIFPFITAELPIMAKNRKRFEDEGIQVSVSSLESLEKAGNKIVLSEMYPELMPGQVIAKSKGDILKFAALVNYPYNSFCCKLPDRCGGLGFAIIDEVKGKDLSIVNKFGMNRYITLDMLFTYFEAMDDDLILQTYEEGVDYSVCVLADHGECLYKCGFEAPLMSYGSAMFAAIRKNDMAYEITERVIRDTGIDGNACCDFIVKPDGTAILLEVNPRLSATLPFIARAGINMPYLRAKQLLGHNVKGLDLPVNYNLCMSKNYQSEYFEASHEKR